MFCTKCGSECPDSAKFCTNCGAPINSAVQITRPEDPDPSQNGAYVPPPAGDFRFDNSGYQPVMPMRWFNFIIYFQLFAAAALSVYNGVSGLLGLT